MPFMYETRGPIIRRFIWWKLRYETGQWVALAAAGKSGAFACAFWERENLEMDKAA